MRVKQAYFISPALHPKSSRTTVSRDSGKQELSERLLMITKPPLYTAELGNANAAITPFYTARLLPETSSTTWTKRNVKNPATKDTSRYPYRSKTSDPRPQYGRNWPRADPEIRDIHVQHGCLLFATMLLVAE